MRLAEVLLCCGERKNHFFPSREANRVAVTFLRAEKTKIHFLLCAVRVGKWNLNGFLEFEIETFSALSGDLNSYGLSGHDQRSESANDFHLSIIECHLLREDESSINHGTHRLYSPHHDSESGITFYTVAT